MMHGEGSHESCFSFMITLAKLTVHPQGENVNMCP